VTARDEMLARIRAAAAAGTAVAGTAAVDPAAGDPAAADAAAGDAAEAYRQQGDVSGAALLDLLADRLTHYRALVRRATTATLAAEISAALMQRQALHVVVPPELRLPLPDFAEVTVDTAATVDGGLSASELDLFDGVVTRAALAIAETGTIVLDGSPDQGRRAISLVPDYHLCVVEAGQVVHLVPEAVERLAGAATRPLTWISGPSATSDIELERVEGVHGPRTLEVILVE
jgi:L-lactate dehydrogenase complex protein LldG